MITPYPELQKKIVARQTAPCKLHYDLFGTPLLYVVRDGIPMQFLLGAADDDKNCYVTCLSQDRSTVTKQLDGCTVHDISGACIASIKGHSVVFNSALILNGFEIRTPQGEVLEVEWRTPVYTEADIDYMTLKAA